MPYETLSVEKRDKGVAWVIVDNPPVNAIGTELMGELEAVADELEADESVRVIVVTSNHPKIFLAGADLQGLMQGGDELETDENPITTQSKKMQACFQKFSDMPKPIIAAINGHALGGGCEFAMACDFRIMSQGRIGLTELSLGIIPGAGGTQRMTKLIGRAKATELIFTAKQLEPEEALEVGLLTKVASPDEMEAVTTSFAEQISEGAVHSMGLAKQAIHLAEGSLEAGLEFEANAFSRTFETDEPGIGLAAFFQKEKPQFLN